MLGLGVYSAGAASAWMLGEAAADEAMMGAADVDDGVSEGTEDRLGHAWGAAEARRAHCARRRERTCPLAIAKVMNVKMNERMVVNVVDG